MFAVVVALLIGAPPAAPRYWAHPMNLEVWPAVDGAAPHASFDLVSLTCTWDESTPGAAPVASCKAGAPPANDLERGREDRLAQCFKLTPKQAGAHVVETATEMWRFAMTGPHNAPGWWSTIGDAVAPGVRPAAPGAFVVIEAVRSELVDEVRGAGCENGPGHTPDGHMIGCDPIAVPTGKKIPATARLRIVLDPRPKHEPNPFQEQHLDVFWVWIGTFSDHFEMDMTYAPSAQTSVPDPAAALALLEKHRADPGPPERRAAVYVDIAIAALRLGDLERGRRAVADLDALVAGEHLPANALDGTLAATSTSLHAIVAGTSLRLSDPCRP